MMRLPRFRSFQARLLSLFLGLLVTVQAGGFLITSYASLDHARERIHESLGVTADVFQRLLEDRNQLLIQAGRVLGRDYGLASAHGSRDPATILSMLENHRGRIEADLIMLLSLDDEIIASTQGAEHGGRPFPQPDLIDQAYQHEKGEAAALAMVDDTAYQLVVLPLLIPHHDGWIVLGFRVDDGFARQLRSMARTQVTVLGPPQADGRHLVASSLEGERRVELEAGLAGLAEATAGPVAGILGGEEYLTLAVALPGIQGQPLTALLQRSLDRALQPYRRLQLVLLGLFLLGLAVSGVAGAAVARGVSRPVRQLAESADRVAEGDYSQRVSVSQRDEIGRLAESFNLMVQGLAERDRVRGLLGKVVSPAIAEELLSKEIELGGEEREVTVMFADIRNFTSLSEQRAPAEILDLLNTLLTRFSDLIEAHGGVVDKYIGDAVMALFGAPLGHDDDAARAVAAALDLSQALGELNDALERRVGARVALGIGVNTGRVVAGNMGSRKRLNYTVLGDGVNLASRLEGLTKAFGVPVLVSETTRDAAPGFVYRELDRVRVKGRETPVTIFEPLARAGEAGPELLARLERHHQALAAYRRRDWDAAEALWAALPRGPVEALYLERLAGWRARAPAPEWDGCFTFTEK